MSLRYRRLVHHYHYPHQTINGFCWFALNAAHIGQDFALCNTSLVQSSPTPLLVPPPPPPRPPPLPPSPPPPPPPVRRAAVVGSLSATGERQTETEIETDTDRETDRETDRQTQTERDRDRTETDRLKGEVTEDRQSFSN